MRSNRIFQPFVGVVAVCLLLGGFVVSGSAAEREELTLMGPPAVVSFPLVHMVETGALEEYAREVRWETWDNPDQLRAAVLEGKADFSAMPSNVVANLHNRGAPVRWVTVSTWGILWMVSTDPDRNSLADFRGAEVTVPYRGDMPDLVFRTLARAAGLNPDEDIELRYVSNPRHAASLLMAGQVDHALLSDPMLSVLLERTQQKGSNGGSTDLHRSVSLREEWGRLFDRESRIPQAGVASIGQADGELRKAVADAYTESLRWCLENPREAGEIVGRHLEQVTPGAARTALEVSPMEARSVEAAEEDLRFFYGKLHELNPAVIGGRVPSDTFFRSEFH